jgi:hypothetical protein
MGWIAAAVAVVGSYAKSQQDKKAAKNAKKDSKEMTQAEAMLARENSQFDAEQEYYYQQLEKKEKSRGLDEFRKFSTVQNYAPNYTNTNTGPVVPTKPNYNEGIYAKPVEEPTEPKKKKKLTGLLAHDLGLI